MNKNVDITIDLTEESKISQEDSKIFKELKQAFKSWKLLRTVFFAKLYSIVALHVLYKFYGFNYTAIHYGP